MQTAKHILVIRFSAMGDVAMTIPVIKNLLDQYPWLQVTVVSNAFFQPLFDGLERCNFYPARLKDQHKGVAGIYRLYKELCAGNRFDAVADLHGVLRASLLRFFFSVSGTATRSIDKGRAEKKALTRKENKILSPLKTTHERYADVFAQLGFPIRLTSKLPVFPSQPLSENLHYLRQPQRRLIGIAPFAQHQEKMYPLERMYAIIEKLSLHYRILLFGAAGAESDLLQSWSDKLKDVHNMPGKISFKEELTVISNLNLMVSMDSANMHLASLFGIPVVSIWGATHPFAGFYGWGQPINNVVSVNLSCRPCSVFGNKTCYRGDHACMQTINEMDIIIKINQVIQFGDGAKNNTD